MHIYLTENFKKKFMKLPVKTRGKFEERLSLFLTNPSIPILKSHPLKGNLLGLRAFSVTGDIRVIYKILDKDTAKFVDIGAHNQVYGF